jgi:hypothetical protein
MVFIRFNIAAKCTHTVEYIYIYWGDPEVDGRIILRWIFRKWEGVVRTGWSWLRIGTGGGHL